MRQWRRPRRAAASTISSQQAEEVMPCWLSEHGLFILEQQPALRRRTCLFSTTRRSLSIDSGRSNRGCSIWKKDASVDQAESPGSTQPTAPPRVPTEAQTERSQLTQLFQLVHTCLITASLSHHRVQDLNFSLYFCLFHQLPSSHFQSSSSDFALVGFTTGLLATSGHKKTSSRCWNFQQIIDFFFSFSACIIYEWKSWHTTIPKSIS